MASNIYSCRGSDQRVVLIKMDLTSQDMIDFQSLARIVCVLDAKQFENVPPTLAGGGQWAGEALVILSDWKADAMCSK